MLTCQCSAEPSLDLSLQVLTALAAAQSVGFRHWDLRLRNIMEHKGTFSLLNSAFSRLQYVANHSTTSRCSPPAVQSQ